MARFTVHGLDNGKYRVLDNTNGEQVVYSYSVPPLYSKDYMGKPGYSDEWGNYYAARGFCQTLEAKQLEAVK